MSLKSIIADDVTNIFTADDSCPQQTTAVYTPVGGSPEAAVSGIFHHIPIHGDENTGEVDQAVIFFLALGTNVSHWQLRGKLTVNSTDYEIINNPYPNSADAVWSKIDLRLPPGSETLI